MKPHSRPETSAALDDLTLAMEPDAIRELGYRIVDMITEEFAEPRNRPVFPPEQSYAAMEACFAAAAANRSWSGSRLKSPRQARLLRISRLSTSQRPYRVIIFRSNRRRMYSITLT